MLALKLNNLSLTTGTYVLVEESRLSWIDLYTCGMCVPPLSNNLNKCINNEIKGEREREILNQALSQKQHFSLYYIPPRYSILS